MNNIFNINRFGMLFKKHTLEHGKTYILSIGVLTGILFLIILFMAYINKGRLDIYAQIPIFVFMMLLSGTIFTSIVFTELGDRSKAIPTLMLPASHFEKYLVAWLYSYIFFQILYVGAFYLTANIVVNITGHGPVKEKVLNVFDTENDSYLAFIAYGFFHAIAFYGSVFFRKLHFIKTAIAFFGCAILLTVLNKPIIQNLINGDVEQGMPFQRLALKIGEYQYVQIYPTDAMINTGLCILALVVLLLWSATYFRLKEKEV